MRRFIATLGLVAGTSIAGAQSAPAIDSSCTYDRCSLSILPRITALDVVRGTGEVPVASLAFLWPRDVRGPFAGNDHARSLASHALRLRRVGAVMTWTGAVAVVAGAIQATSTQSGHRGRSAAVSLAGLALVGASVPVHFAADAALSRAVWWYNRGVLATVR